MNGQQNVRKKNICVFVSILSLIKKLYYQHKKIDWHENKHHFKVCIWEYLFFQVVDSVMALFRVDFSGRGELADRQQKLAQFLSRLQKISEEYNVAVLITNQMTADPGATLMFQVK